MNVNQTKKLTRSKSKKVIIAKTKDIFKLIYMYRNISGENEKKNYEP